ncbi:MAG TPA: NAD-dependent dehydratase [Pasteurellaceae bacterium]|nr:NAD-dependent dehydratase [Pasteurellaceae bacterium]
MIIGSGMLAKAFAGRANDEQNIIFASGVSNSAETNRDEFLREENLLRATMQAHSDKKLIYFSTCSIYDSTLQNSLYVYHKTNMERLIRENQRKFIIFRLPQVVGFTRSPTVINFLYHKILEEECFDLWVNSKRNLIDVEDVVKVIDYILDNQLVINQIVNLAAPQSSSIYEIVMVLEQLVRKRAIYRIADKGTFYHIDLSQVKGIYTQLGITFGVDYVSKLIGKYYADPMQTIN